MKYWSVFGSFLYLSFVFEMYIAVYIQVVLYIHFFYGCLNFHNFFFFFYKNVLCAPIITVTVIIHVICYKHIFVNSWCKLPVKIHTLRYFCESLRQPQPSNPEKLQKMPILNLNHNLHIKKTLIFINSISMNTNNHLQFNQR